MKKIILDLSDYTGKFKELWYKNTPDKIRLAKGKYYRDYDIHSVERRKKWYKETESLIDKEYPGLNKSLPIGIDVPNLPNGVEIIEEED